MDQLNLSVIACLWRNAAWKARAEYAAIFDIKTQRQWIN